MDQDIYDNREKAVRLYQEAAEQGDAKAQNTMGRIYQNQTRRVDNGSIQFVGFIRYQQPTDEEYKQAAAWNRKAAEQGLAIAQVDLARMYQEGHEVSQSEEEALKWYRKAADQNFSYGAYYLAEMYEKGKGVVQSDESI